MINFVVECHICGYTLTAGPDYEYDLVLERMERHMLEEHPDESGRF